MTSIIFAPIKVVFIDFLRDIVYFPLWWYSRGTAKALFFCLNKIKNGEKRLGLKIWVANLFRPMFGQYDLAGKIISFFIRLIQIIARSILMLLWIILMIALFFVWLIFPPFVIYQIIINLG
jgi:hypothetical protein